MKWTDVKYRNGLLSTLVRVNIPRHDTDDNFISFRVKLAMNRETQEAVAVKILDLRRHTSVADSVKKEVFSN